jgi:serine/threonine protein kinase
MSVSDDHRRALFSDARANSQNWEPIPAAQLAQDLAASHPHYRITHYLKHGGMGAVYRATDTRADSPFQDIAIKFIRHDLLKDAEYMARFDKEIATLQRMSQPQGEQTPPAPHHQGIIRILAHGRTAAGVPFFVMPFLEGEALAHLLEKPRLELPKALRLMTKLCAAIAYAHTHLIIHRDLKPANIFLIRDANGELQPVILDFGVARSRLAAATAATLPGQYHGTAGYIAPEVIRGEEASYPADIFALGKICFQLLNGNDPRAAINPRLKSVILEATADAIGMRFQTASEFVDSIKLVAELTQDEKFSKCPICYTAISKTARQCPVCGEDQLKHFPLQGWWQLRCKGCQRPIPKFSKECPHKDCLTTNRWAACHTAPSSGILVLSGIPFFIYYYSTPSITYTWLGVIMFTSLGYRLTFHTIRYFTANHTN